MVISFDYTLITVLLGASIVGLVAGSLGCFAMLKRQSLVGDAISHAALPGIALAFLLTQTKNPLVLLLGAAIAGFIGTSLVHVFTNLTKTKEDAALGIILSVFFGFGIFLLTIIQKLPSSEKSGLQSYLFGNAATMLRSDVITIAALSMIVFAFVLLFWKQFKLLIFDKAFAKTIGMPIIAIELLLTLLIVGAIVVGLQTVGVVLMSAMVIAPAVAARQWTDNLGIMVVLAACIGALSASIGTLISSSATQIPTGPTIVVVLSIIVIISLFFSWHRGLLFDYLQHKKNRKQVRVESTLLNLYYLSLQHDSKHAHTLDSLQAIDQTSVLDSLSLLERQRLVQKKGVNAWVLTKLGFEKASQLVKRDDSHVN